MRLSNIALFLLYATCIKAQLSISNLSLTDTSQNIFYIGVDNIIKISGKQYDPVKHHTVIMGGGGTLHKMEKGVYTVRVQEETDNCQVWITESNKPVFKQNFRCRKIEGDPIARLAGVRDSFATIEQITANPFLIVEIPGTYYKHKCQVTSFVLTMDGAGFEDKDDREEITGHIIPEKIINRIKKLGTGSFIGFENIYCLCADSRRRKLKAFVITIK